MDTRLTVSIIFGIAVTQVAESLLNPFGGDDDDFEINPLIENNLQVRHTHPHTDRLYCRCQYTVDHQW